MVHQRVLWTAKRSQGRFEAKSERFDEELQSQNTPPENIFFRDFQGVQKGPPGEPRLTLLLPFYSQNRSIESLFLTFEAFL